MLDEDLQERTILLVDSAPSAALMEDFVTLGFRLFVASDSDSAIRAAVAIQPEFALVELRVGDACGIEILADIVAVSPPTRAAIVTLYGSIESARIALSRGAVDYFTRPVSGAEVIAGIAGAERFEVPPAKPMGIEAMRVRYIREALARYGSLAKTSRALRVERKSLRRMLRRPVAG
jgi:two-component system, response regulator RegA